MNIWCLLGFHDYEPFYGGIKLVDLIEEAAKLGGDYDAQIYDELIAEARDKYYGGFDLRNSAFKVRALEHRMVRNAVCLREDCRSIQLNMEIHRKALRDRAKTIENGLKREKWRQNKALEIITKDRNRDCL